MDQEKYSDSGHQWTDVIFACRWNKEENQQVKHALSPITSEADRITLFSSFCRYIKETETVHQYTSSLWNIQHFDHSQVIAANASSFFIMKVTWKVLST